MACRRLVHLTCGNAARRRLIDLGRAQLGKSGEGAANRQGAHRQRPQRRDTVDHQGEIAP
jgi:hypothetical protein